MIFEILNNEMPLKDASRHEVVDFFTEQVYFSLMDEGMVGLQTAVHNAMETQLQWCRHLAESSTLKFVESNEENTKWWDTLYKRTCMHVMSGIAQRGSVGVYSALVDMCDILANTRLARK